MIVLSIDRSSHLIGGGAAQKGRQAADLLDGGEVHGGLLFGQQIALGLVLAQSIFLGPGIDLPLHQGGQDPAGADRV